MSDNNFSKKKNSENLEIEAPQFDLTFQASLLKLCLSDDYFCSQCCRYLSEDADVKDFTDIFDSITFQKIFDFIAEAQKKYGGRPDEGMIRQKIREFAEDERDEYYEALDKILNTEIRQPQYYQEYLKAFVTQIKISAGMKRIKGIWKEKPNEAPISIQKLLDSVNRVAFEKEDEIILTDFYGMADKEGSSLTKIPTGIHKLDELMRGGFPRETLVTVLGASNAGKSIFCYSLGCSALRRGFKVLSINLEGTRADPIFRYISNLADLDFNKIEEGNLTSAEKEKIARVVKEYGPNLVIRNMLNFGQTVEDVISYCREKYKDFKFDMLIVDYGQLLKTKEKQDKNTDRQTEVYRALDSLSKEFRCVVISPVQSTRDGIKKQNDHQSFGRKKDDRLPILRSGDMADCIEIARVSAVILTLNRTEFEENKGWLRVFLEKQRKGPKAVAFGIKANYPHSNLITNDYYDPNGLLNEAKPEADPENVKDAKKDNSEINLSDGVNKEYSERMQTAVTIKDVAFGDDPQENEYNKLVLRVDEINDRISEIKLVAKDKKDLELDEIIAENKRLKQEKKNIKEKAKTLLPLIKKEASKALYELIKESIHDLSDNPRTLIEKAKAELYLKQLALVFDEKKV